MNPRRLYRCRHDRVLAGVASGMAEYLDIDPTLVRILWIISAFFGGFTILLYILFAFIMPIEPVYGPAPAPAPSAPPATPDAPAPRADAAASADAATSAEASSGYAPSGYAPSAQAAQPYPSWTHEHPAHDHARRERRPGRMGLYVGVMLVVFGTIAAVNALIPGLASGALIGAALLVALGAALLVGAARPGASDQSIPTDQ